MQHMARGLKHFGNQITSLKVTMTNSHYGLHIIVILDSNTREQAISTIHNMNDYLNPENKGS